MLFTDETEILNLRNHVVVLKIWYLVCSPSKFSVHALGIQISNLSSIFKKNIVAPLENYNKPFNNTSTYLSFTTYSFQ
jgi:hypothetical protein